MQNLQNIENTTKYLKLIYKKDLFKIRLNYAKILATHMFLLWFIKKDLVLLSLKF